MKIFQEESSQNSEQMTTLAEKSNNRKSAIDINTVSRDMFSKNQLFPQDEEFVKKRKVKNLQK